MDNIIKAIKLIETKTSNPEWINGLDPRKKEEADFHDYQHDHSTELGNEKFYKTTSLSSDYFDKWLKLNVKDKVVLDYACGNGDIAYQSIKYGAKFISGIDISPGSIANCNVLFKEKNVAENDYRFFVGDCENTELPSDSFDVIICSGMLHHLNLDFAYPEMNRILKKGGKIIAVEALDYNPFIKLYRLFTPAMRTVWEKDHILSMKDIRKAKKLFKLEKISFFHITSFLAAFFNSNKYILKSLNFIDNILTKIPFVRLMSWQFIFELKKK